MPRSYIIPIAVPPSGFGSLDVDAHGLSVPDDEADGEEWSLYDESIARVKWLEEHPETLKRAMKLAAQTFVDAIFEERDELQN